MHIGVTNKYVRGINLIYSEDGTGANKKHYMYNGHGDVIQLTNDTGDAVKSYNNDAFGIEKNSDMNDTNVFRYCGEYFDKETGTIYLRARYYDPDIGRFISEDSVWGNNSDPLSLNLYTYAYNNPIMFLDPSGHIGIKPDGSIYMAPGDTLLDMQLLQLKIDYDKPGADTARLAAEAKRLRDENPNLPGEAKKWHVSADKLLDYYMITDITETLNNLMTSFDERYTKERVNTPDKVLSLFYNLVKNKGPYDLKNRPESVWQHEHFYYEGEIVDNDAPGNISYGYLGKVMGINDTVLVAGAGYAQIRATTSKREWINTQTFGDDPRDTARIKQGIQIYKNTHSRWLWWW